MVAVAVAERGLGVKPMRLEVRAAEAAAYQRSPSQGLRLPVAPLILVDGTGDAEMTMVEDARIARDALNRLTALLAKSDVTPEEILDVANHVQIKDKSRLSSRHRDRRGAHQRVGLRFVTSLMR